MIEIKNVDFFYETAESEKFLKKMSALLFQKGQVVLLCGESGSGKTTFGRLINGLIPCYTTEKWTDKCSLTK